MGHDDFTLVGVQASCWLAPVPCRRQTPVLNVTLRETPFGYGRYVIVTDCPGWYGARAIESATGVVTGFAPTATITSPTSRALSPGEPGSRAYTSDPFGVTVT